VFHTPQTRFEQRVFTTFESGRSAVETVVCAVQAGGEWKVERYDLRPSDEASPTASQPHGSEIRIPVRLWRKTCLVVIGLTAVAGFLIWLAAPKPRVSILTGRLTDSVTGAALPQATIELSRPDETKILRRAKSDTDGQYRLEWGETADLLYWRDGVRHGVDLAFTAAAPGYERRSVFLSQIPPTGPYEHAFDFRLAPANTWTNHIRLKQILALGSNGSGNQGDDEFKYGIVFDEKSVALTVSYRKPFGTQCRVMVEDRLGRTRLLSGTGLVEEEQPIDAGTIVQLKRMLTRKQFDPIAALILQKRVGGSAPSSATFGPVIERTLPLSDLGYSCSLNLESAEMRLLPASLTMADWSSGIRLPDGIVVIAPSTNRALMVAGTGTEVVPLLHSTQSWNKPTPAQLDIPYALSPEQTESVSGESSSPPVTFAFRTAKGLTGLLQITGFTDNPRGVTIRYKLLQSSTATISQAVSEQAAVQAIVDYGGFVRTNAAGRIFRISLVYDEDESGNNRRECEGTSDRIAEVLPAFPELEELWLQRSQATDRAMRFVGRLKELKSLWIWYASDLSDAGVAELQGLHQLETLFISDGMLRDDTLKVLAKLPRLQKLQLQGNGFTDHGLKNLSGLTQLTNLWLGLGSGGITDEGLQSLSSLVNLQELELQEYAITDAGLHHLLGLEKLRSLWLSGTKTTHAGRKQLQVAIPGLVIHE
jgi:hypothetical protein